MPWDEGGALGILGLCFLLGGAAGCILAAWSDGQGAQELSAYLEDYLFLAGEGELAGRLWPVVWDRMRDLLAAMILGATVFGIVGLPVLMGVQGFFLSFSVGCFCRVFGGAGLLPAFALFGLPALLWAPSLFLIGVQGFQRSRSLLSRTLGNGGKQAAGYSGDFWRRIGLCAGLSLGCALLEHWVVPVLLEACARVVL